MSHHLWSKYKEALKISSVFFTNSISDLCRKIIDKEDSYQKRIKCLEEENKKFKDEHSKDSEIQRMKTELKEAKEDLYRGFPISKKEKEAIEEWRLKHEAEVHGRDTLEKRLSAHGTIGGSYTYVFTPTSIGVVGEIKCNCGETFTFQDL